MSAFISIPDDLLAPLQKLALRQRRTLDQLTVQLLREAVQMPSIDYPILQNGRFAYFDLPLDAGPLDLEKIQAALNN